DKEGVDMNEVKSQSASRRILSLPLLLLLIVILSAALLTAGVAFAGTAKRSAAGNSSGPAARGNGPDGGTPTATPTCPQGWTIYPNPARPGESALYGVTAIGPNDLWAVGYRNDAGTP